MYAIVFIDLDGTLLNEHGLVTPRTRAALSALRGRGLDLVLASGRAPRHVREFQRDLGLDGPAICYNGALISASPAGGVLWQAKLSGATAQTVLSLLRRAGVPNILCEDDDRLAGEVQDAVLAQAQREQWGLDPGLRDLPGFLAGGAHKLIAIGPQAREPALRRLLTRSMRRRVKLLSSAPGADWLEIVSARAGKAEAARRLCRLRGLSLKQAIAFGDAENDAALLAGARLGVAMANGDPLAIAAARMVAPANSQDGLAQVVEALLAAG